ncbi:MAG: hypothetical protein SPG64_05320 [Candidatus Enteromonas sp.]|nr:hypothetical protein [Candidatus Enteromonas sp.]
MNKKTIWLMLPFLVVSLVSCADTSELYDGDAYAGSVMIENRYSTWDEGLVEPTEFTMVPHGQNGYFNGSGNYDDPSKCFGFAEAKSYHPEYFVEGNTTLMWTKEGDTPWGHDISGGFINEWTDNSHLVGTVYGQTKKLTNYQQKFAKGYLSKLYNGQIKCNAWSYYSMVLLDSSGYGTAFPSELQTCPYFAFVARGASDTVSDWGVGRVMSFDIRVTFYKKGMDGKTIVPKGFLLPGVLLQADRSSELTSLVGFSFSDVGYDPAGIMGMSITYDLVNDPLGTSSHFDDGAEFHTGLSLLEVFFPDSTWN